MIICYVKEATGLSFSVSFIICHMKKINIVKGKSKEKKCHKTLGRSWMSLLSTVCFLAIYTSFNWSILKIWTYANTTRDLWMSFVSISLLLETKLRDHLSRQFFQGAEEVTGCVLQKKSLKIFWYSQENICAGVFLWILRNF